MKEYAGALQSLVLKDFYYEQNKLFPSSMFHYEYEEAIYSYRIFTMDGGNLYYVLIGETTVGDGGERVFSTSHTTCNNLADCLAFINQWRQKNEALIHF